MGIIKEEKKIARHLNKENMSFALMPIFVKDYSGNWVFTGQTNKIYTIEEFETYKDMYAEIYDSIQMNFASNIANVYKAALNSFVVYDGQTSKVSELFDMMLKGKSVGLGKVFAKANSNNMTDSIASVRHILNGTNKIASGKSNQPFRPFRLSGKGLEYVLPEFSNNGVVAEVEGKKISVKFRSVSQAEAESLKEFMLSCVPGQTKEEIALKQTVENYFAHSKHAAEAVKTGAPEEIYKSFSELNLMSSYLFDTDLTRYEKQKPEEKIVFDGGFVEPEDATYESEEDGFKDLGLDGSSDFETVKNPTKVESVKGVAGIDMKAKYATEASIQNGGLVIRLSPVDGLFEVTFNPETQSYVVEQQKGE